jgi:hypothetical protein
VAFGYFENLFQLGDTAKVAKELERIKSFNRYLDAVGQQEHLYDIFVDATEDLLLQVSSAIENGTQDESFLLEAFNSEYGSSAIITHFRVGYSSPSLSYYSIQQPIHPLLTSVLTSASDERLDEIESLPLRGFSSHAP